MRLPISALLLAILAATGLWAVPAATADEKLAEALGRLPENQWTAIDEAKGRDGGVRQNAAVVWLADQKKFLVVGGLHGNINADRIGALIPYPYEVQTFDPATQAWENVFPKGKEGAWGDKTGSSKAPGHDWRNGRFFTDTQGNPRLWAGLGVANTFSYDPDAKQLYLSAGSKVAVYDVAARTCKELKVPPLPIDLPKWSGDVQPLDGTRMILDPVNKELLFLGGRCGILPRGTVGSWAFNLKTSKWRPVTATAALLDPLRVKCLAALRPLRDGEARLRGVLHSGLDSAKEAEAVKGKPHQDIAGALQQVEALAGALAAAKPTGWEANALAHGRTKIDLALANLKQAQGALTEGKLDAGLLRLIFTAGWALDEAADALRAAPGPRTAATAGYDLATKQIILFGGDHGDYTLNDTWVYDCTARSWCQIFPKTAPPARMGATLLYLPGRSKMALIGGTTIGDRFVYPCKRDNRSTPDIWVLDLQDPSWSMIGTVELDNSKVPAGHNPWALNSAIAAGEGDVLLGLATRDVHYVEGRGHNHDVRTLLLRPGREQPELTAKQGAPASTRRYMTSVALYDPCWFDDAPRGDRATTEAFLEKLPPNDWTEVPKRPRTYGFRCWGTTAYNPDLDEFYQWSGGHEADASTVVSTYHPATNRCSIGYVAEFLGKGITFNGRPDCANHTYRNWCFDTVSRKLVAASVGGVSTYDPQRREWDGHHAPPFIPTLYGTVAAPTNRGVVFWNPGLMEGLQCRQFFGLFDARTGKFTSLPVKGALPSPVHGDMQVLTYDPKRDVLWMIATQYGGKKSAGQVWRYDMKKGVVDARNPAGMEACAAIIEKRSGTNFAVRESVYLPKMDLLFYACADQDRHLAYDPENNRWVTVTLTRPPKHDAQSLGGVGGAIEIDTKRDLIWCMGQYNNIYVVRLDPKTVQVAELGK